MLELNPFNKKYHLIGIGGVGVSAIAEILQNRGYQVSGSDLKHSTLTKNLELKGIKIFYTHEASHVEDVDVVVYTTAVGVDNPELARAIERGIPCITRADMLGIIMREFKQSLAISGSHGKTTTTSMVSVVLSQSDLDPTLLIGGEVKEIGSNARVGHGDIIVTEACEYKESFLSFKPKISVVLNIEADHLDYFRDLDHIKDSFRRYIADTPENGVLILNGDDPNCMEVADAALCKVIKFGLSEKCDYQAAEIEFTSSGYPRFTILHKGKNLVSLHLNVPGRHNIYNALAAFVATTYVGIPDADAAESLSAFKGAVRRFDHLGEVNGIKIIDDYAHHPSEVKATLSAAMNVPHNKIFCVFQPHTYTRTLELLNDFSTAFDQADVVIITDIYAAREKDMGLIHSRDLAEKIKHSGKEAYYIASFDEIAAYLKLHAASGDLIFTMGAGNINELGQLLVE
ncbi:UDP-N-acetylmuramate--L-alanine ligase [Acidaminobacter hydrogenoformans]|uniref:UDP-N-acetylmuramate--L-alanine ligase n=1 Tax=Acidaminobacter hydrogenoformans DSM 2784 TaxID=1120920 RepID=A0A1G5RSA5_9FIRM|nr:UDP-N-acetylmuramate--L-alanine ligase [Acidaminobacter hydrogenoformans]SCZ76149.1 UDP-N-acetylmuramate--L-alanine ligase [Acidaminobacter hydrogenoformans DSM 2784]